MSSRRRFLGSGLAALAYGLLPGVGTPRPGVGFRPSPDPAGSTGAALLGGTTPVLPISPGVSVDVGGYPFHPWFTGDDFQNPVIPFHAGAGPGQAEIPQPTERVDVAVVGGGLSGLTSAYLLRRFKPVVLELRDRMGGNALGESWEGIPYSLGSAYVITPDEGSLLENLYGELGLDRIRRESFPPDPMEFGGVIHEDFWSGMGVTADEQPTFARYAEVVQGMAENSYPEIPLPEDPDDAAWVRDLDRSDFRTDLERRMAIPLTPRLAAGIQSYFYSSFGVGMSEVSAASGWNFLAAEEFGRWVFPGGNSAMAHALWQRLKVLEGDLHPNDSPRHLRCGCRVIQVKPGADRVLVTYADGSGRLRSLAAKQVVMAGSKHVAKYVIQDLESRDPERLEAMNRLSTVGYLVAQVLLNRPVESDFYDAFLIGDDSFPMEPGAAEAQLKVTDMLRGDFSAPNAGGRSVLTLYWPLPYPSSRFTLIAEDAWSQLTQVLAPQIDRMLETLGVSKTAVRQVRMSRWGHAMPVARPGFIADGWADKIRAPLGGNIHFVNQDNWALPAVENSLLDAATTAAEIGARLRS